MPKYNTILEVIDGCLAEFRKLPSLETLNKSFVRLSGAPLRSCAVGMLMPERSIQDYNTLHSEGKGGFLINMATPWTPTEIDETFGPGSRLLLSRLVCLHDTSTTVGDFIYRLEEWRRQLVGEQVDKLSPPPMQGIVMELPLTHPLFDPQPEFWAAGSFG